MHQLNVNGKYKFETDKTGEGLKVDGKAISADIARINSAQWHVINNLASYNVEVISFSRSEKTAEIKVGNNVYFVNAKDQFDILLDQLGLSNLNSTKVSDMKAPMPGMVLKVFVSEGAEVKKGDNLFILEAMKMENIIKAPADVVVKTVKIKAGDKVEKGQILLMF
jgi:biotin carboxyl carrier protein